MISIARHIELLLLEHDCVIVPGFGGFIASHNAARYNNDGDSLYLPPYRTIAFNENLTINDGLLVLSYMSAYDASYPSALLQMESDIDDMARLLDENGEYRLEGVGTLSKSMSGGITFSSFEAGVLTPSLYGLYSVEIHSLEQVKKDQALEESLRVAQLTAVQPTGIEQPEAKVEQGTAKVWRITPRVRRLIEVSASAAAAVALFVLFVLPATRYNGGTDEIVVASALNAPTQTKLTPAKTPAAKQAKPSAAQTGKAVAEAAGGEAKVPQAAPAGQSGQTVQAADEKQGGYTLVLASYVSEHNANIFIANLRKEGLAEAKYVKKGKVSRVLYSAYATEAEAISALRELRSQSSDFANAWVMAL